LILVHVTEKILEVISAAAQKTHLILQNLFGTIQRNWLLSYNRLP